mmetsp:Transcript_68250/g.209321  ORF Transcript_68250/g.209321 Transcript_68250/m.209321 type:complete len:251 (+) Transcript_68250:132-884(+)
MKPRSFATTAVQQSMQLSIPNNNPSSWLPNFQGERWSTTTSLGSSVVFAKSMRKTSALGGSACMASSTEEPTNSCRSTNDEASHASRNPVNRSRILKASASLSSSSSMDKACVPSSPCRRSACQSSADRNLGGGRISMSPLMISSRWCSAANSKGANLNPPGPTTPSMRNPNVPVEDCLSLQAIHRCLVMAPAARSSSVGSSGSSFRMRSKRSGRGLAFEHSDSAKDRTPNFMSTTNGRLYEHKRFDNWM